MYKKSMRGGVVFMLAKAEKYKQLEKWNERFKMDVLSRSLTADHSQALNGLVPKQWFEKTTK